MQCPLCEDPNREDIKDFDNAIQHCVMVLREDGAIHIHGPFDKPPLIKNFIEKMIVEAEKHGIVYKPRIEGKGD